MTSNLKIILYSHFGNFRQAARNLFVNSVLKRVTTNNAKNLRRKTAQEFLTGNSAPFLALVGVRSDFSIKLTDSPLRTLELVQPFLPHLKFEIFFWFSSYGKNNKNINSQKM